MAFNNPWVETDPPAGTTTVSQLDDYQRQTKAAIRERLEGDAANPNSGVIATGTFAATALPKIGAGRFYTVPAAAVAALSLHDGRGVFTSDTNKLIHLKETGAVEIAYLNRDGSRAPLANLPMGAFKLTGLGAGSANGDSVRFEQALLIDIARTVTGLLTFNRGAAAPFAIDAASNIMVANLNADLLDGLHAAAFALTGHGHVLTSAAITGTLPFNKGGTGIIAAQTGSLFIAPSPDAMGTLNIGQENDQLTVIGGIPSWRGRRIIRQTADDEVFTPAFEFAVVNGQRWMLEVVLVVELIGGGGTIDLSLTAASATGIITVIGTDETTGSKATGKSGFAATTVDIGANKTGMIRATAMIEAGADTTVSIVLSSTSIVSIKTGSFMIATRV